MSERRKEEASVPDPAAEAQLAAEVAAEHAARAAEQAEVAERELAEVTKEDARARLCPHDHAEMVQHSDANPYSAGAWHCNACGCCFKGRSVRAGHVGCPAVAAA